MATYPFLFEVTVANEPPFDDMLADVAACVLGQVGYGPDAIADMLGLVRDAVLRSAGQGIHECAARFLAEDGQLLIVVSDARGREWRTTRPLP